MKKIILIPLLLISILCSATNYYVKTGGNDASAGTTDGTAWAHHPWMSTWTGTVVLVPGDVVYMNKGDTWSIAGPVAPYLTVGQNGSSAAYITTSAYGAGADPIISISTADVYPVIGIYGKSYLIFDNLDIRQNSATYFANSDKSGIYMQKDGTNVPHHITITNCTIHNIPHSCIYVDDDSYDITVGDITATITATAIAYSNNLYDYGYAGIHLTGCNPTTLNSNFYVYYNYVHDGSRTVAGDLEYGICFTALANSTGWPKYVYARYNRIENMDTWECLDIHGGSYVYFQDNYIKQFGKQGLTILGTEAVGRPAFTANNYYIERNTIEQPIAGWVTGVEYSFITVYTSSATYKLTDIYVRDNLIYYTTRPADNSFKGIRLNNVDGITVSGNKIYNGESGTSTDAAIYITGDSNEDITLTQNYICQWGPGIDLVGNKITGALTITNNIVALPESNVSLYISGANLAATAVVTVYNNTFINETYDYVIRGVGTAVGSSLTFKNNIIGFSTAQNYYYYYFNTAILGTFVADYNIYWNSTLATAFDDGTTSNTWAQWQTAGYDANSPNTGLTLDPQFKNVGGSYLLDTDYDIENTSPAINQGIDVGLVTDYSGSAIYGLPDIGAWEFYIPSRVYPHITLGNKRVAWNIINNAFDTLFVNSFDRVDALYDSLSTIRGESLIGLEFQTQLSAALTDGAPTDAQIDAATGLTPVTAGTDYQVLIKDTNGTALLYIIWTDGTDWYYIAMTKSL